MSNVDDENIGILVKSVFDKYGYDFSDYSIDSFRRRVSRVMIKFRIADLKVLEEKLIRDESFFNSFLEEVTVTVTEMFRDPEFYKALRNDVIPALASLPVIRIWHAGCSTGEEVYSLAILLKEAGLLHKSLLYATDINPLVLNTAAAGRYSLENFEAYSEGYKNSGGKFKLSDYFKQENGQFVFGEEFKSRMVFSTHNLVHDQSFNEFSLIMCRNVLIYFNRSLKMRVLDLFVNSLSPNGFLALGTKESILFTDFSGQFEAVNSNQKIWRKKK